MITYDEYEALCVEFLSPKKAHLKHKVGAIAYQTQGKGIVSVETCNFTDYSDARAFCLLIESNNQ